MPAWNEFFPYDTVPESPQLAPYRVQLEANKNYWWCSCGKSKTQPWCDGKHNDTNFKPVRLNVNRSGSMLVCGCKRTISAFQPRCRGTCMVLRANQNVPKACAAIFTGAFLTTALANYILHK